MIHKLFLGNVLLIRNQKRHVHNFDEYMICSSCKLISPARIGPARFQENRTATRLGQF